MNAEAVVYALLSGAGPVTAIVGSRIYPVAVPEKQPTPAIAYTLISSNRWPAIDAYAPTHHTRSRVQVSLLTKDFTVLRGMRAAVVAALQFQRGAIAGTTVHSITLEGEGPDIYDEALGVFMRPVDFLVSHEAT